MSFADLQPWEPSSLARGTAPGLANTEARCTFEVLRAYYWLLDIAPILLKYEAIQLWRDMKREITFMVSDFMDAIRWRGVGQ
jgi:hypothetical protein